MESEDVIWGEDPGPNTRDRRGGRVARMVEALKERPGEWGRDPVSTAASNATHRTNRYPGTEWTARRRPDNRYDLYGRWVGTGGDE